MLASTDLKIILLRPIIAQVICLIVAIFFSWQFIAYVKEINATLHPPDNYIFTRVVVDSNNSSQLEKALSVPLFGKFISKEEQNLSIKRTNLNLNLIGVLFSPQKQNSYVIIRTADRKELVFKIGDTIPGVAVIKEITIDSVVIERDGGLESLSLPKNELVFDAQLKPLK